MSEQLAPHDMTAPERPDHDTAVPERPDHNVPATERSRHDAPAVAGAGYDPGVPASIAYPALTLPELLRRAAREYPDRTATILAGATLSYRELDELVDACAAGLIAAGVAPGDRVAVLLPNVPQFIIAFYGILRAGAVAVLCNILYTAPELAHQLADSGAETLIALDLFMPTVRAALAVKADPTAHAVRVRRILRADPAVYLPPLPSLVYRLRRLRAHASAAEQGLGVASFDALVRRHRRRRYVEATRGPEEVAALLYTGGTTGVAKGAMLSQRNLLANALQIWNWNPTARRGQEVCLCMVPFFHSSALTACLNLSIYGAATMVLLPRFVPAQVVKAIRRYRATYWCGHPHMFRAVAELTERRKADFSSLRLCISGGDYLPPALQQYVQRQTGCLLYQAYGMTETGPVTLCQPLQRPPIPGSIGLPFPDTEARLDPAVVNDGGDPAVGELLVRGPQIMSGYWGRPDETALVLKDGWMRTGDVARVDAAGNYYIVDRLKDVILVDTLNIYPSAVEDVLCAHPRVREAAVVGLPDERHGQCLVAYVVPVGEPGEALTRDILAHCSARLAAFKVPARIEYRAALPKTSLGKIPRRELRRSDP